MWLHENESNACFIGYKFEYCDRVFGLNHCQPIFRKGMNYGLLTSSCEEKLGSVLYYNTLIFALLLIGIIFIGIYSI